MDEVKSIKFPEKLLKLEGISERQIREHWSLYEGYIKKIKEVREKLESGKVELEKSNQTYSDFRGLKLGETFAANGVILHQGYFSNLGGVESEPGKLTKEMVEKKFGTFDGLKKQLSACGMACRGWAILVWEDLSGDLQIIGQDAHDVGAIYFATPIIILDVYEHAYFMDFGTKRADYIETFWKNIDWDEVEKRVRDLDK